MQALSTGFKVFYQVCARGRFAKLLRLTVECSRHVYTVCKDLICQCCRSYQFRGIWQFNATFDCFFPAHLTCGRLISHSCACFSFRHLSFKKLSLIVWVSLGHCSISGL